MARKPAKKPNEPEDIKPDDQATGETPKVVADQETTIVAEASDNAEKDYQVSKAAPPKIYGKKVKDGDTVRLTDKQALSYLNMGALIDPTIKPVEKDKN